MHLARFSKFAIVAVALVAGNQAKSASTNYGTYYDEYTYTSCGASGYCRLNFSQLSSTDLTKIKKIHCTVITQTAPVIARLQVAATNNGGQLGRALPLQLPPPSAPVSNGYIYTSILVETDWLIGQARFPYIEVFPVSATPFSMECTLIGETVAPIS
ncbi:hypothetical protein [Bradyrhizobium manausense]|uniref:hypothetical protein n=1 Tax=Bradyrhizobium manausense TaxID=989370 RepID=UPI001BA9E0A3|nr:hypothetical protein [Bradyrhizobium manausense]MBR0725323.1 hypothetical protein [Bradyrhizobium manausense]